MEAYQTMPNGHLMSAIEETAEWSVEGKRPEAAPAGGNDEGAVAEFDKMVSGLGRR